MLNKLVLNALLSLSLAFSFAGAANATLISQDILDNGAVIGNVTIDTDDSFVWDAIEGISIVQDFTDFQIYGYDLTAYTFDFLSFDATYFHDDLAVGLDTLNFELTEQFGFFAWAGDIFSGFNDNVLTISDNSGVFIYSEQISLGNVTVPTPATLVLFLTALTGLAARRKNS
ncbi:PEP-CTERM sorting domain-containing protein [Colwellia demingiae]|uniref:PEP-CTERM sorting domain-containing protein n=1 Tax=Colwellia demingiae TaxID=89401 RepID=A0A5C6Q574_9GAMM|nr:PEP-CTERM sorting domain-containing protein [Colwellia demingiae]TWX63972.1 PEP-CTERM sorting domain-containing protein [Colwellia demingiae]